MDSSHCSGIEVYIWKAIETRMSCTADAYRCPCEKHEVPYAAFVQRRWVADDNDSTSYFRICDRVDLPSE